MKIKLLGLAEGEHVIDGNYLPADLGLNPEELSRPVSASVIIDKRGGNYYIKVSAATTGQFYCDRCLEGFESQLTGEVALVYTEHEELFADGGDDELRMVPKSGDEVDLTEDVRDAVLLSVPIKRVCAEDCKGLCPVCGANKNTGSCSCSAEQADARWDALRKLKL